MRFWFSLLTLWGSVYAEKKNVITLFHDQPHHNPQLPFPYVEPSSPPGGEIRIGHLGSFTRFHPFSLKGEMVQGASLLYATLFKVNEDDGSSAYPYLAENVEIFPKQIIFYLRKEATFSDDSPISAQDVVFSFKRLVQSNPLYQSYYGVRSAETRGAHCVVFHLEKPKRDGALILAQIPILSERFFNKYPNLEKNSLNFPLSSGPYILKKFIPGQNVTYERRKKWWGEHLPCNKGFYLFSKVLHEYFRDRHVIFEAFCKGDLDVFIEPSALSWHQAYAIDPVYQNKIKKAVIICEHSPAGPEFLFNIRSNPGLFEDMRVRKAFSLLFPFPEMNRQLFFNSYKRSTSIFQNTPFQAKGLLSEEESRILEGLDFKSIDLETLKKTPLENVTFHDLAPREALKKALSLFKEAGWELENGTLRHQKTGKSFQFVLTLSDRILEKVVMRFQNSLQAVGITMHMRLMEPNHYQEYLEQLNFVMIAGKIVYPSVVPGSELPFFLGSTYAHKKGGYNYVGIENTHVDKIVQKILKAESYRELLVLCKVLDRLVIGGHYAIQGWYLDHTRLAYWAHCTYPKRFPKNGVNFMTWWKNK